MTYKYLVYEDRKRLEALYNDRKDLPDIANALGVHLATIYRELARGSTGELDRNGRNGYSADLAQKAVQQSFKRRGHKTHVTT